jgi:3-oxosteroid 1-dehydrogenase
MSSDEKEQKGISRRSFVKGAVTGVVGGVVVGAAETALPMQQKAPMTGIPRKWDYQADLVIVGLGGAGACAAIEAFDHKATVLVLEKQPKTTHYSNTRMSGGIFHTPDPTGSRAGLESLLQGMMSGENLSWKLEGEQPDKMPEMAKSFAEGELQINAWLKTIDPELVLEPSGSSYFTMYPGAKEAKYMSTIARYADSGKAPEEVELFHKYDLPKLQKSRGEALMHALVEVGIKNRAQGIRILYRTPAKRLVMDKGEVVGVVAMQEGKEIACKAKKAVILSCGGYEYNKAQRKAFLEGPGLKGWCFYGTPDNTGDGIEMAIQIGAGMAKVGKAASRIETAVPYGRGYQETGLKMGIQAEKSTPNSIIVDNFGKRYCNENDIGTGAWRYQFYKMAVYYDMYAMDYPRIPSYCIFDETRRAGTAMARSGPVAYGMIPWTKDNMRAIQEGWILKGETIEDLAAKIKAFPDNKNKMNGATLAKAVSDWNAYCAAGKGDPDFKRPIAQMAPIVTPPFYAMPLYAGGPNTKGGIDANAQRQVLDWRGKVIPRFYTAGEISSVFKWTYQAGGNVTECIVCGRIAGRNAAALKSRA